MLYFFTSYFKRRSWKTFGALMMIFSFFALYFSQSSYSTFYRKSMIQQISDHKENLRQIYDQAKKSNRNLEFVRSPYSSRLKFAAPPPAHRFSVDELLEEMNRTTRFREILASTPPLNASFIAPYLPTEPAFVRHRFRSCAVVPNTGALRQRRFGAEIDANDAVFRFNFAPTRGFETQVGNKTSFRVVNSGVIADVSLRLDAIAKETKAKTERESAAMAKEKKRRRKAAKKDTKLTEESTRTKVTSERPPELIPFEPEIPWIMWDGSPFDLNLTEWFAAPKPAVWQGFEAIRRSYAGHDLRISHPRWIWRVWEFLQRHAIPADRWEKGNPKELIAGVTPSSGKESI